MTKNNSEVGFRYEDKGHSYYMDGKKMSGVTTILNSVLAKPALIGWAAKMTAEWIRENIKLVAGKKQIAGQKRTQMHESHYEVYESDLEEAVKAHSKKKEAGGKTGTDLHAMVEAYIKLMLLDKGGVAHGFDAADPMVQKFIDWAVENNVKFLASEQSVYHRDLWYAGTFDFSFEKDGKRYIGDLKTHKKLWDRTPFFQTAAYMMASEAMGEKPYDGSCIVNINKETNELTDHWTYDHENDKKAFEAALVLYRQLSNF